MFIIGINKLYWLFYEININGIPLMELENVKCMREVKI